LIDAIALDFALLLRCTRWPTVNKRKRYAN